MATLDFGRGGLGTCVAAAILAGCGGSPPHIAAPDAMPPQDAAVELHAPYGGSWMLPGAKSEDLLYVATGDNVYVLSYPAGRLTGTLHVPGHNICSDNQGNVFVPQTATDQIIEYAHGASAPIQTLNDGDQPLGCAVDPTTGNLAVTNEGSGEGEVAIYPNAQEPAQWYRDPQIFTYGLCGYDNRGNLFLDGTGSGDVFAEFPEGRDTFVNFNLNSKFAPYGSVQWDGKYITLTNPSTKEIYRLESSKSRLRIVGTTRVRGWQNGYSSHWPYIQTWLQGDTFLAQSSTLAEIGLWPYPGGGRPKNVIGGFGSGNADVYGVAISVAKH